jgi:hypothetical protein
MSFNLNEKVAFLNNLVDESLTLIYYTAWELSSYGKHSLFSCKGRIGGVRAKSFTKCIDKAMEAVKEEITNG